MQFASLEYALINSASKIFSKESMLHNQDLQPEFIKALQGEDDLGVVVRGHIYIEARLNEYLSIVFSSSKHLSSMNLRYKQKVQLACAVGMNEEFLDVLAALGDIRNSFSHKLNAGISREHVLKIWSMLPAIGAEAMQAAYDGIIGRVGFDRAGDVRDIPPKDFFVLAIISLERFVFSQVLALQSKES